LDDLAVHDHDACAFEQRQRVVDDQRLDIGHLALKLGTRPPLVVVVAEDLKDDGTLSHRRVIALADTIDRHPE
jgi:hypothetical protein